MLAMIAHIVLQHSTMRGRREVTQLDFRRQVDWVLHASQAEMAAPVAEIERKHNSDIASFAGNAPKRAGRTGESGL